MTGASSGKEKPPGAWTAQETVLYMVRPPSQRPHTRAPSPIVLSHKRPARTHVCRRPQLEKVRQGKFYILCPDNETRHEVDQLRIMWGAGDVAEGRPALSRWHRDYKALFEEYIRDGLAQLE